MKKKWLLLFLLLFNLHSHSQQNTDNAQLNLPKLIPPNPEAAALGRYGEIPVSYYTGVPNINIPIYDFLTEGMNIPISLSYHAGGFKVEDIASNVGMGWALNIGGVISSTINGLPDFAAGGFVNGQPVPLNLNPVYPNSDYQFCDQVTNNIQDSEPDQYFFNFPGRSGKFVFDHSGIPHQIPFSKIRIERINKPSECYYVLTDEKGYKYIFDNLEISTVTQDNLVCPASTAITNPSINSNFSWQLSKIITPLHKEINFEYETYTYSYFNQSSQTHYVRYPIQYTTTGCPDYSPNPQVCPTKTTVAGQRIKRIYNDEGTSVEIQYNNIERLDLKGSNSLQKIIIKVGVNIIKEFNFSYDYFVSLNPNNITGENGYNFYRLKLTGVKESGKEPYLFLYDESTSLPHRLSYGVDFWGFSNGKGSNITLIPAMAANQFGNLSGADREPDEQFMKNGLLTKISYPTGGSTEFTYESHKVYTSKIIRSYSQQGATVLADLQGVNTIQFTIPPGATNIRAHYSDAGLGFDALLSMTGGQENVSISFSGNSPPQGHQLFFLAPQGIYNINANVTNPNPYVYLSITWEALSEDTITTHFPIGGIRVKEIKNNSLIGIPLIKKYNYNNPTSGNSSGFQVTSLTFSYDFYKSPTFLEQTQTFDNPCRYLVRQTTSLVPLGVIQGSNVAYEYVTESYGQNQDIGKTQYRFTTFADLGGAGNSFPIIPTTSNDWIRGLLKEKIEYKKESNDFFPVRKTENSYKIYNNSEVFLDYINNPQTNEKNVLAARISKKRNEGMVFNSFSPAEFSWDHYKYISAWFHLDKTIETIYSPTGTNPLIVTTNFYHSNTQNIQLTKSEINNSKGALLKTEMKYPHDFMGIPVYDSMNARNMISPVIEQKTFNNNNLISQSKINYNLWNIEKFALPQTVQTGKLLNPLETELTYYSYDNKGNPLQYISKDGVPTSFVWGYRQQYPVAKVAGATYSEILAALGQSDQNLTYLQNLDQVALTTELNKIRNNLKVSKPISLVTTFTYSPLIGMQTQTDPNGKTVTYEYDIFNRLKYIKDQDNNVIKRFCYNYSGQPEDCAVECVSTVANWQNTTTGFRCQLSNGQNTGWQEQEQRDINSCSPTFNQLRWIQTVYNATSCPLPQTCNSSNCTGESYKCVNGQCELGYRVNTISIFNSETGLWECIYHYEFSDGSWSQNYSEFNIYACPT